MPAFSQRNYQWCVFNYKYQYFTTVPMICIHKNLRITVKSWGYQMNSKKRIDTGCMDGVSVSCYAVFICHANVVSLKHHILNKTRGFIQVFCYLKIPNCVQMSHLSWKTVISYYFQICVQWSEIFFIVELRCSSAKLCNRDLRESHDCKRGTRLLLWVDHPPCEVNI